MSQRFEGHFTGPRKTELFYQIWRPEKIRGRFIITHGLAEHGECYHHVAKALCEDGWEVIAWDLRGHGRSEGKRGYVNHLMEYVDDFDALLKHLKKSPHNQVLFGHSMGGLITIRFLQEKKVDCAALVLSSPALGLTVQVPKFKEKLAHFAVKWMPTLTLYNEIKYEDLTRDEEMWASYRSDTLRHDKISPGLFLSMLESFPLAHERTDKITMPVLLQLSGEDRIVSSDAARDWFERLPSKKKQLCLYPESLHEIYNDRDRAKVMADLKKFINAFLES